MLISNDIFMKFSINNMYNFTLKADMRRLQDRLLEVETLLKRKTKVDIYYRDKSLLYVLMFIYPY